MSEQTLAPGSLAKAAAIDAFVAAGLNYLDAVTGVQYLARKTNGAMHAGDTGTNPDADLINMCSRFQVLLDFLNAPNDMDFEDRPGYAEFLDLVYDITVTEALTTAGLAAKFRAAWADSDIEKGENLSNTWTVAIGKNLFRIAERADAANSACDPGPIEATDTVLIAKCDRVLELHRRISSLGNGTDSAPNTEWAECRELEDQIASTRAFGYRALAARANVAELAGGIRAGLDLPNHWAASLIANIRDLEKHS